VSGVLGTLQNYQDFIGPPVTAAWLNAVDNQVGVATPNVIFNGTDAGVVNVANISPTGLPNPLTNGTLIRFTPAFTNTGAVTITTPAGTNAVVRANGSTLTGGEFSSLGPVLLQFNGVSWQIVATAGAQPGFERSAAEIAAGIVIGSVAGNIVNTKYLPGHAFRYGTLGLNNAAVDLLAIQSAINQSASNTPGAVQAYVPVGNYNLGVGATGLVIPYGAQLTGAGLPYTNFNYPASAGIAIDAYGLFPPITGITQAAQAVITVNQGGGVNPFTLGSTVIPSNVLGMTQINGLGCVIVALGGVTGAWTITVNINSSAFGAYSSGGNLTSSGSFASLRDFFVIVSGNGSTAFRFGNAAQQQDMRRVAASYTGAPGTASTYMNFNANSAGAFSGLFNAHNCYGQGFDYGFNFQNSTGNKKWTTLTFLGCQLIGPPTALTASITGITQAASAVITVNTVSATNPFILNEIVQISGVNGMTQINGLFGIVTALGGASGAWTITVNINSSAFSAYTSSGTLTAVSTGIWEDGNSDNVGSVFHGGVIEGFGRPYQLDTPGNSGMHIDCDVEGNTFPGAVYPNASFSHRTAFSSSTEPALWWQDAAAGGANIFYRYRNASGSLTEEHFGNHTRVLLSDAGTAMSATIQAGTSLINGGSPANVGGVRVNPAALTNPNGNWMYAVNGVNKITWGSVAPSSNAWAQGDLCILTGAAPGSPPFAICTVAGSPGTWTSSVEILQAALAGWGTPTGGAAVNNFPGATATLLQTSTAVAQIIATLKSFGLFAT
jgi:hypothetical protein